jgi:hypothetical protein
MRRVARVTEYLGSGDGCFYVEEPDIPEGLTCREWRVLRFEVHPPEQSERVERSAGTAATARRRRTLVWPGLRPRPA